MKVQVRHYSRWMGAAAALALAACGGGGDDGGQPAEAAHGAVLARLQADAPACGLEAVNVTISKLRLHQNPNAAPGDSGWVELAFSPAKRLNLLGAATVLGGATTDLGEVSVPAGIYSQARIVLDGANTVKPVGAAAETAVATEAALASVGTRFPIDVKVDSAGKATLVLGLNACGSIQRRADAYVLKPRPVALPAGLNGIAGFVDKAALAGGVVVMAQQNGGIFATTVPHPVTGEFLLPRLPASKYDVVILASGRAAAVIGAVPVEAAATVAVATAAAPITPAASATGAISGTVSYAAGKAAPDGGTWVQASQTIPANLAVGNLATPVTYRFQSADLATGAYALAGLPRAQAQFALYKPALPLTFANPTTSPGTGRYRVEAVASGFSNTTSAASSNVDIGTANKTGIDIQLAQ